MNKDIYYDISSIFQLLQGEELYLELVAKATMQDDKDHLRTNNSPFFFDKRLIVTGTRQGSLFTFVYIVQCEDAAQLAEKWIFLIVFP